MFRRARCFPISAPFFSVCGTILVHVEFSGQIQVEERTLLCVAVIPWLTSLLSLVGVRISKAFTVVVVCEHHDDRKAVFLGLPVHTVGLVTVTASE